MAIEAELRQATKDDLPALVEIEQLAFSAPNWTSEIFIKYECTIAEVRGQIAGFLVSRQIYPGGNDTPPEREILNIAVAPPFRRGGIATALLKCQLSLRADFFLEVRESNCVARSLYQKVGFQEIARRANYYDHPVETAIVMQMKWC